MIFNKYEEYEEFAIIYKGGFSNSSLNQVHNINNDKMYIFTFKL